MGSREKGDNMLASSLYKLTAVVTATAANACVGGGRLMAIELEGGSDASSVDIFNAASETGTAIFTMSVGTALSQFRDFSGLGGIPCPTGIWVKPTGTAAICYVWTD
jgi:hypothetical protein